MMNTFHFKIRFNKIYIFNISLVLIIRRFTNFINQWEKIYILNINIYLIIIRKYISNKYISIY